MTNKKIKDFILDLWYYIYKKGIRRLIPKYHNRTIFTRFYWRTWWDRRTKGFDETETWSLDYSLSKLIAPRIEMFIRFSDFGIPNEFLNAEYKKSMAKGYEWDSKYWQIKDKAERKRCWKRATNEWQKILHKIHDGFADEVLESKDWDAWNKKWQPQVNKINKQLNKAKTEAQRKEIWNSIKTSREYRKDITCCTDDLVYNVRKEARSLLAEYYNNFWW